MLRKFIPKFADFFKDGNETFSSTRLAFLLWISAVLVAWIASSIINKDGVAWAQIDPSVLTLIGILMTGKVVQSFSPNEGPAPTAPTGTH